MKRSRDDFSTKTIKLLKDRVGHRCSNPGCRVPTSGSNKNPNSFTSIGQAAHITAAAKGGPRYALEMTSDERASIDNAIWLCNICARKIDVDHERYDVLTLRQWKIQAEHQSVLELGQKLPTEEDGQHLLASALKGLPSDFKRAAISNVHKASQQFLNSIDPRFSVETAFENGITKYMISAKEDVTCIASIPPSHEKQLTTAIANVEKHGIDIKLSDIPLTISGSPLFEELGFTTEESPIELEITGDKIPAVLKFSMQNPETNEFELFDDLSGFISYGTESFSFKGRSFGGLFGIEFSKFSHENLKKHYDIDIGFCLDVWQGKDIRRLPYLSKLVSIYRNIKNEWIINIAIELEGEPFIRGKNTFRKNKERFSIECNTIEHIARLSEICKLLDIEVFFKTGAKLGRDEYVHTIEILDILKRSNPLRQSDIRSNPKFTMIANENLENWKLFQQDPEKVHIFRIEHYGKTTTILSQEIELPTLQTIISGAKARIFTDAQELKEGGEFVVECVPTHSFAISENYLRTT